MKRSISNELSKNLDSAFLTIVPTIERVARRQLTCIFNADDRADAIADVVALTWKWFVRLAERGKDARRFPAVLAYLACRSVRSGRRVWGSESKKDAMSMAARLRHGFHVQQLEERGAYDDPSWQEALIDNMQSPVPDQASFRLDFPRWLNALGERNRRVAQTMLLGEGTFTLSRRFGVSPGRVSQLRREFEADWQRFHGEVTERDRPAESAA